MGGPMPRDAQRKEWHRGEKTTLKESATNQGDAKGGLQDEEKSKNSYKRGNRGHYRGSGSRLQGREGNVWVGRLGGTKGNYCDPTNHQENSYHGEGGPTYQEK